MRAVRLAAVVVMSAGLILTGCTGMRYKEPEQPRTIYSSSDATALAYSDPIQASPVDDHPFRWLGFILHPLGLTIDYAFNRPMYRLASDSPAFFGYTAEDAQLDSQRDMVTTD